MKVTLLQDNFSKTLQTASRFASTRAQLPVLNNLKLEAKGSKLVVSATNLEVSINTSVGAKVKSEGEISIPAKTLADIVVNLSSNQVNLEAKKEKLTISTENFNSVLSGINTSDFPDIPDKTSKDAFTLDVSTLSDSLNKVLFSVSNDETRPILTGVYFNFSKEGLVLVSTDGFRLTEKKVVIQSSNTDKLIVPKSSLSEVVKLYSDDEEVKLDIDKKNSQIIFNSGNTTLASRILGSDFPDYKKRIPEKSNIEVKVDKESFQKAVKLASVFARESSNIINFAIKKDSLEIQSKSSKSGSGESRVDASVEGDDIDVAFNYKYVEEILNVIESDEVVFEMTDSSSPVVVKDTKDKSFLHIIMPVKV